MIVASFFSAALRLPGLLFCVLIGLSALAPAEVAAAQDKGRTLEGGIQIWTNGKWSLIRADVGPRWAFDWFSIHPHGAVGPAFLPNVVGTPLSLGAYLDLDAAIPVGNDKAILFGPGGGFSMITGMFDVTGVAFPHGYFQGAYRWGGNLIGIMALWGRSYEYNAVLNIGGPERIDFRGIGLRFEYVID